VVFVGILVLVVHFLVNYYSRVREGRIGSESGMERGCGSIGERRVKL
jgi:hypothetical protein